jgi:hypothetical protein
MFTDGERRLADLVTWSLKLKKISIFEMKYWLFSQGKINFIRVYVYMHIRSTPLACKFHTIPFNPIFSAFQFIETVHLNNNLSCLLLHFKLIDN